MSKKPLKRSTLIILLLLMLSLAVGVGYYLFSNKGGNEEFKPIPVEDNVTITPPPPPPVQVIEPEPVVEPVPLKEEPVKPMPVKKKEMVKKPQKAKPVMPAPVEESKPVVVEEEQPKQMQEEVVVTESETQQVYVVDNQSMEQTPSKPFDFGRFFVSAGYFHFIPTGDLAYNYNGGSFTFGVRTIKYLSLLIGYDYASTGKFSMSAFRLGLMGSYPVEVGGFGLEPYVSISAMYRYLDDISAGNVGGLAGAGLRFYPLKYLFTEAFVDYNFSTVKYRAKGVSPFNADLGGVSVGLRIGFSF